MPSPIALQLFTVRESLGKNFAGTIKLLAEIGYVGVEPFGLTTQTVREANLIFRDFGLEVPSVHLPVPVGKQQGEILETATALDSPRIVSGYGQREFNLKRSRSAVTA